MANYIAKFEKPNGTTFTKVFDCNNLEDATIEGSNYEEANEVEMLEIDLQDPKTGKIIDSI